MKVIHITKKQLRTLKENIEQDTYGLGVEDDMGGYAHITDSNIAENAENEVEADDVDMSSFKPQDSLASGIWDGNKLNSRVRLQLLDIADDFIDTLDINKVKPKDIVLIGSICNYNWSNKSDIDVHVVYDFSEINSNVELVTDYMDAKKNAWNDEHPNLNMHGFSVEMYVQNVDASPETAGVYSLEKNKWLRVPSKDDAKLHDIDDIKKFAAEFMTIIDDYEKLYHKVKKDKHKVEELGNELEEVRVFIKEIRKKQLEKGGEMSVGNIVYKVLRRMGYQDKLYKLQNLVYDTINSI